MGLLALLRLIVMGALFYFGLRVVRGLLGSAARSRRQGRPDPWGRYDGDRARRQDGPPPPSAPAPTPFEVLGVAPSATQKEIRAAYQSLVRQYHPDRVAGLGPELRELAERRTKEINSAYEQLRRR